MASSSSSTKDWRPEWASIPDSPLKEHFLKRFDDVGGLLYTVASSEKGAEKKEDTVPFNKVSAPLK